MSTFKIRRGNDIRILFSIMEGDDLHDMSGSENIRVIVSSVHHRYKLIPISELNVSGNPIEIHLKGSDMLKNELVPEGAYRVIIYFSQNDVDIALDEIAFKIVDYSNELYNNTSEINNSLHIDTVELKGSISLSQPLEETDPIFLNWKLNSINQETGKFNPELLPDTQGISREEAFNTFATLDSLEYNVSQLTSDINNTKTELEQQITDLSNSVSSIVTYQFPAIYTYQGVNTFELPKIPVNIAEVRVYDPDNTLHFLQAGDYSVSENIVTINNPTLSDGMSVRVFYFA